MAHRNGALEARGGWWGIFALAVACGCSSNSAAPAGGGGSFESPGGNSGSNTSGGGASGGGRSGGGTAGGSSALGGSSASGAAGASGSVGTGGASGTAGGLGTAGAAGAAGANANPPPKCAPAQIYCNGSCLQRVGDSVGNCSVVLIDDRSSTRSLASDGSSLYFTGDESADRLELSSHTRTSLVSGLKFPESVVLDGDTLYVMTEWTEAALGGNFDSGTLRQVPKAGGPVTMLAQGLESAQQLTVAAGFLYFERGITSPYQLSQESVAGPSPSALGGVLASGVDAFVVDGGILYYSNLSGLAATHLADLSQSVSLAPNVRAQHLISDATNVYFFDTKYVNNVELTDYGRVAKSGGSPQIVHLNLALGLEYFDGKVSYLIGSDVEGEQKLYRMPLAADSAVPIATFERDRIRAVTADSTSVYVALAQGGIVRITM